MWVVGVVGEGQPSEPSCVGVLARWWVVRVHAV